MMKWLRRKLRNFLTERENNENMLTTKDQLLPSKFSTPPTLQFSIYNAIGGSIVEFRRPIRNQKNVNLFDDAMETQIYLIHKNEDIGERLAKIITLEHLKG